MSDDRSTPTGPEKQEFKLMLGEITQCLRRMDDERDQIKEIVKVASEKYDIKGKLIRKVANTMYKHNYADVVSEHEHFEHLYESMVEGKST